MQHRHLSHLVPCCPLVNMCKLRLSTGYVTNRDNVTRVLLKEDEYIVHFLYFHGKFSTAFLFDFIFIRDDI